MFLGTVTEEVSFLFTVAASSCSLIAANCGAVLTVIEPGVVVRAVLLFLGAWEMVKWIELKWTAVRWGGVF